MWTVASRMRLQTQPIQLDQATDPDDGRPFGMRFATYNRGRSIPRSAATVCPQTQLGFIDGVPVADSGDTYCNTDSDGQDVLVTDTHKDD